MEEHGCDASGTKEQGVKRLLWWIFAGTRGGLNRAKIINSLIGRPMNAHQIAEALNLDYKTIRHHLRVLEENGLLDSSGGGKYGTVYFPSRLADENVKLIKEIWEKVGKEG
jgi:DNA-binding transcriptional ArsR family regulator